MNDQLAVKRVNVFVGGDGGYPVYRIPSLIVTSAGSILAFAEGRQSRSDQSENDIVMRRSTDKGTSWSDVKAIASSRKESLNNPQVVQVRETGRLVLFYQRYPYRSREHSIIPGFKDKRFGRFPFFFKPGRVLTSHVTWSDDDGQTWSEPLDITRSVKRPERVTTLSSGPGIGIQLAHGEHAGRILMPFNEGPYGHWRVFCAYSDDSGETWNMGEVAPEGTPGHANEVQVVERSDGSVLLNARSQGGSKHRKVATSTDGGVTWSPTRDDETLVEPQCMASIIRHSFPRNGKQGCMLFSNPATISKRTTGTIRASFDDGNSWPCSRVLEPGNFAYSCLGVDGRGDVLCLYETGSSSAYEKIALATFPLSWVIGSPG